MNNIKQFKIIDNLDWLINKNSKLIIFIRRLFLVIIDLLILPFSVAFTNFLVEGNDYPYFLNYKDLSNLIVPLGFLIYLFSGQYKGLAIYEGSRAINLIILRNGFLILTLYIIGVISKSNILISQLIILWLVLAGISIFVRFTLRDLLINIVQLNSSNKKKIIIYGAGSAAALLASNLKTSKNHIIKCFLDDNRNLWGRNINGIPIKSPEDITDFSGDLDEIYLAIPSLKMIERRRILLRLKKFNYPVSEIPSIEEITSGKLKINNLKPLKIEELLERNEVISDVSCLSSILENSTILITGAGGSIGSEICRQILKIRAKKIIMLDNCESNLYQINLESEKLSNQNVKLLPLLGNACDISLVKDICLKNQVDIIYHAAAYKHVPLVEANPIQGIENNIFSTIAICEAAKLANVKKCILVSTDKSVRPTNIMGASKRVAELVVLANSEENSTKQKDGSSTMFSMVRFGNVLNSSGSVVPLFLNQIADGGPITLTHPDIIRYFMTIPEAAQLVLQASLFSKGGEVFLLDMGAPVRIIDLARKLIKLSCLTEKDSTNPEGDIEIQIKGLRPGEKLYEEMLISNNSESTDHPLIYKARDNFIKAEKFWPKINSLKNAIDEKNISRTLDILKDLVPEWKRHIKK